MSPAAPSTGTEVAGRATATTIGGLDTPVALVEVRRLEANLARMAQRVSEAGTAVIRPHTKSHKTREIARRQLAHGARGITVAKVGEAEAMVGAGFDDVYIAYPILGDDKYRRMLPLMERARLRIGLDSYEVAAAASAFFAARGQRLEVLIELDSGFGRCGVESPEAAVALGERIGALPGVELVGTMGFGGHAYRTEDVAAQSAIGRAEGEQAASAAASLRAAGHDARVVSCGSTPSTPGAAGVPGVTEVRPGVYVFYDLKQVSIGTAALEHCALSVLTTVVSHPRPDRWVVDAGIKALAGEDYGWGTYGRLLEYPELVVSWAAEEHGIITLPADVPAPPLRIGDRVRVVPDHACGTVNMHQALIAVDGDAVVDTFEVIGRGRIR